MNNNDIQRTPNVWALTPLVVFLVSYVVVSCIAGDFYKMPITVAFLLSSVIAIAMSKGGVLSNRSQYKHHVDGAYIYISRSFCPDCKKYGSG